MATADKLTYLNETKNKIRKVIESENLVAIDDTTTFREYSNKIKSTNEEIKKYIPTDSQSGTSLQVTNAVPLNIKKGVIDGNSYQYTTSGKNKFNVVDYTNMNVTANSGAKLTGKVDNFSFITSENDYCGFYILVKDLKSYIDNYEDNKNYIVSFDVESTEEIIFYYGGTTRKTTTITPAKQRLSVDDILANNFVFYSRSKIADVTINISKIMVSETDSEYEPYTRGASPNPDYPQNIEVVSGKNLCDGINQNYYINNVGNLGGLATNNSGLVIPINGEKKFTISTNVIQTRYRVGCINQLLQEKNTTTPAYNSINKDGTNESITIDTTGYKYLLVNATDLTQIQIEKGSIATEILPFDNLKLTNSGKNICPTDYEKYWEKGQYSTQGVKEEKASRCRLKELLRIKPNTDYYCSCYLTDNSNYRFAIRELDKNKNFVSNKELIVNGSTYTSSSNAYYIAVTITYIDSETEQNYEPLFADGTIQPLICLSSCEDKTFEPYRETDNYLIDLKDNFLAKIGDVKDTLDLTSGVLTKRIGKYEFKGTENITSGGADGVFYTTAINDYKITNNNTIICSSNFFKGGFTAASTTKFGEINDYNTIGFINNSSYVRCYIKVDNYDASSLKSFLLEQYNNGTPVVLYYQLETPETIQLDPINIKMYEETNNIELDTNLEANMSLDYYKDYLLDNQEVEVSGVTE